MTNLSRHYAKLCDVRDFEQADLLDAVRSLLPERDPLAHVERKAWEFAMVALFLGEVGRLSEGTRLLSVGAGNERIVFWLAQRVGRLVAVDLYGEGDFAEREAGRAMLEDPRSQSPWPYPEERLEVMRMDARELEFEDASFDSVITVSSMEHFGSPADRARAAAEIGRVLRPGGHAAIVTDVFVSRHPLDAAPVEFAIRLATFGRRRRAATPRRRERIEAFTEREVRRQIVEPSGLVALQPFHSRVSPESFDNVTQQTAEGLRPRSGAYHPHIVLQVSRSLLTSACLVLQKR